MLHYCSSSRELMSAAITFTLSMLSVGGSPYVIGNEIKQDKPFKP